MFQGFANSKKTSFLSCIKICLKIKNQKNWLCPIQNYSCSFVFTTDYSSLFIYLRLKTVHLYLYILSCFAYPSHCPLIISFSLCHSAYDSSFPYGHTCSLPRLILVISSSPSPVRYWILFSFFSFFFSQN